MRVCTRARRRIKSKSNYSSKLPLQLLLLILVHPEQHVTESHPPSWMQRLSKSKCQASLCVQNPACTLPCPSSPAHTVCPVPTGSWPRRVVGRPAGGVVDRSRARDLQLESLMKNTRDWCTLVLSRRLTRLWPGQHLRKHVRKLSLMEQLEQSANSSITRHGRGPWAFQLFCCAHRASCFIASFFGSLLRSEVPDTRTSMGGIWGHVTERSLSPLALASRRSGCREMQPAAVDRALRAPRAAPVAWPRESPKPTTPNHYGPINCLVQQLHATSRALKPPKRHEAMLQAGAAIFIAPVGGKPPVPGVR